MRGVCSRDRGAALQRERLPPGKGWWQTQFHCRPWGTPGNERRVPAAITERDCGIVTGKIFQSADYIPFTGKQNSVFPLKYFKQKGVFFNKTSLLLYNGTVGVNYKFFCQGSILHNKAKLPTITAIFQFFLTDDGRGNNITF